MNKNRDKLKSLLTEAAKRPMTKEERAAQARSFVRAEMGFGSDADEAAYLAALSARDTAAIKRLEAESKARMDAADQYFEGKGNSMSDDLVNKLRDHSVATNLIGGYAMHRRNLADEAADRIEALDAEVERLRENTGAGRLLEWISYHHLPLQLWREDDGQWVVVDGSTNHVLGSGEDAEGAIRAALSADKTKEAP